MRHRSWSSTYEQRNSACSNHASKVAAPGEHADLAVIAERLTAGGATVRFQLAESWRPYDGHGGDLLELNRVALDGLITEVSHSVRSENRIEGRVSIHPTACTRTSVIVGPAVIGEGACVENAYIGPYTSVGAGARIEGAEIERSIISPRRERPLRRRATRAWSVATRVCSATSPFPGRCGSGSVTATRSRCAEPASVSRGRDSRGLGSRGRGFRPAWRNATPLRAWP